MSALSTAGGDGVEGLGRDGHPRRDPHRPGAGGGDHPVGGLVGVSPGSPSYARVGAIIGVVTNG